MKTAVNRPVENDMTIVNMADAARTYFSVRAARRAGTPPAQIPLVYFDITRRCDSACVMCAFRDSAARAEDELSTEEIKALAPALASKRARIVSFGGGEPILRPDLEEIIRAFRREGISAHVNSNGLSITPERAASLADAGLSMIYISCDHCAPEKYRLIRNTDGFDSVVSAVENFKSLKRPVPVGINVAVSSLNESALEDIADFFAGMKADKIQFTPVNRLPQHKSMTEETLEPLVPKDIEGVKSTLRKIAGKLDSLHIRSNTRHFIDNIHLAYEGRGRVPCYAGFLWVVIDPAGNVMPCYEYDTGLNIREKTIEEIMDSGEFRSRLKDVKACGAKCFDCGSAETGARMRLAHAVGRPFEVYGEIRMHGGA
ncbi:MAG: Cyclic pyranopterin monophosphate synthase [bacterium ADurb.Bin236]|nr:MAG: Cyclic pyranopterin monophosphate synthase [bacterium ADurb.Bin236]